MNDRHGLSSVTDDRRAAQDKLRRIVSEHEAVLEELATAVERDDRALGQSIRKAEPESLRVVPEWALPHLRRWTVSEGGKLSFEDQGMALLSRLGALYADVLLRNNPFLEWRVGDDPENPQKYVYQWHPVVGVKSAEMEIDPFAIVVNVVRGILRGSRRSDALVSAYHTWTRDARREMPKG